MKLDEILGMIKGKRLIIYGTGYTARHFYQGLMVRKRQRQVMAFAETTCIHKTETLYGIPVISVNEIKEDKDILICIAVHETIRDEIICRVASIGCMKYVWVYPFIRVLLTGDVLKEGCHIRVKDIISTHTEYSLSIRILAAEQYYGLNEFGYRIYLKFLSCFNNEDTSQKRLEQYKKLMKSWDDIGYIESEKISVDEKFNLLDGAHRVALAYWHECKDISGDIYPAVDDYRKYGERAYADSVEHLKAMKLSAEEIYVVTDKYKQLKRNVLLQ